VGDGVGGGRDRRGGLRLRCGFFFEIAAEIGDGVDGSFGELFEGVERGVDSMHG
jgi:hypothetical protein